MTMYTVISNCRFKMRIVLQALLIFSASIYFGCNPQGTNSNLTTFGEEEGLVAPQSPKVICKIPEAQAQRLEQFLVEIPRVEKASEESDHIDYGNLDSDAYCSEEVLRILSKGDPVLSSVLNRSAPIGYALDGRLGELWKSGDCGVYGYTVPVCAKDVKGGRLATFKNGAQLLTTKPGTSYIMRLAD